MTASLTKAERCVLEVAETVQREGSPGGEMTHAVRRRTLGLVSGDDFRTAVASLADRRLLQATVTTKAGGAVGPVVIKGVTVLGRLVLGRASPRSARNPLRADSDDSD